MTMTNDPDFELHDWIDPVADPLRTDAKDPITGRIMLDPVRAEDGVT